MGLHMREDGPSAVTVGAEETLGQTEQAAERRGRTARGDRTRAALATAAMELFREKGVERTAVDEITAAAAVAKGTFYVHFQRKEDALLEHGACLVEGVSVDAGSLNEALERLILHLLAAMEPLPRPLAGRMIREIVGHREDWERILGDRRTLKEVIRPAIEQAQRAGEIRTDLSPGRIAQGLTIVWLDTIIGWAERAEPRDLGTDLRRATTLVVDGARHASPPPVE